MTKSLVVFATALFLFTAVQAQEEGAKMAKSAGKALTTYNLDPTNNGAKLDEAKQKIEEALQKPDAQALASAWLTKGDIYATMIEKDEIKRSLGQSKDYSGDNDALPAFEAYKKANELAVKKFEKTEAIKGIGKVQGALINIGAAKFEKQEYEKAYLSFNASLQAHDLLAANAQKSALDEPKQLSDITYYGALGAYLGKRPADALVLYEKLYKAGTDNAEIYNGIYTIRNELGQEAEALKILEEGRKKFPENTSLLFAEINIYLKKGKLDELTARLKDAIKAEPNNVSLYLTLGNVYENLYSNMLKEKNDAKAAEYFAEAKTYYSLGMEKDPKNADAVYSLGALYYNKAALRTTELNALPEDFSSAGIKKYETLKKEIMGLFDEALPYFKKAEGIDANDTNTLIALTEIFARKEDDLALEFKKRLQNVKDGGKNAESYFK